MYTAHPISTVPKRYFNRFTTIFKPEKVVLYIGIPKYGEII